MATHQLGFFKHPPAARSLNSGFSLIEVLVATVVFSLGLAGFAALLLSNMVSSAQARNESTVSMAAANLAEQIRLNPDVMDRYFQPPEYIDKICNAESLCTPQQQADYDFRFWQIELADSIPGASAVVCRDGSPQDGSAESAECNGDGAPVIKIFWQGRPRLNTTVPEQGRYVLPLS
jgi:type IV pilus assembly protein PilV